MLLKKKIDQFCKKLWLILTIGFRAIINLSIDEFGKLTYSTIILIFFIIVTLTLSYGLTLNFLMITGAILPPDNGLLPVISSIIILLWLWTKAAKKLARQVNILLELLLYLVEKKHFTGHELSTNIQQKSQRRSSSLRVCSWSLVVLVSLGISLPTFSFYSDKKAVANRQNSGKFQVQSLCHNQQRYYQDKWVFYLSDDELKTDRSLTKQTEDYTFSNRRTDQAIFYYAISRNDKLKSYVGGVFLVPLADTISQIRKDKIIPIRAICEANSPGQTRPADPVLKFGIPLCGPQTSGMDADNFILTINRAQQERYSQTRSFASSLSELKLNIPEEKIDEFDFIHRVWIDTSSQATFSYATDPHDGFTTAYIGGVFVTPNNNNSQPKTIEIVCEHREEYISPDRIKQYNPTFKNGKLSCQWGGKKLNLAERLFS
ncbi:type IV pilin-like G/H family protein [Microcoleus sp. ARI1-B5]|uniref:type IV pilin-like G/H family protein n=1 Tax=unclassified Microcoleus TaxID=2642155 RepID=UPI002FD03945